MKDFPDTITSHFVSQYEKKLEEVLKEKITALTYKALERNEIELYDVLKYCLEKDLEQTSVMLKNYGYHLVIERPDISFTDKQGIFKMVADMSKVKVCILKTVIEY